MINTEKSFSDTIGFNLLGPDMGDSIKSALQIALKEGAIFAEGTDPLSILRKTLDASIRKIETHSLDRLFKEFLLKGPYDDSGIIPPELIEKHLSDEDTATVIKFIFSFMVNSFKGAVAELLAAKPCMELVRRLQKDGKLPKNVRLYVGDSVLIHAAKGKGLLKGADLHLLIEERSADAPPRVSVLGVTEVKSYKCSERSLQNQLGHHLLRAKKGIRVGDVDYPAGRVSIGYEKNQRAVRIIVLPGSWKLPRSFRFEESKSGRLLYVDPGEPLNEDDEIIKTADGEWRIILKWSKEALAEAAYEMTFWYMEKIGEVIYDKSVPKGWEGMSPADAGRNAAKHMLYYAILRCRSVREKQKAIALYNSYGYGYALGMNYKNAEGKREMLWPEDLDEILSKGKTKKGCTIC